MATEPLVQTPPIEPLATTLKQAGYAVAGITAFLLFWAVVLPKETNAWVGFPFNGYWAIWLGFAIGLPVLFVGGRWLFRKRA